LVFKAFGSHYGDELSFLWNKSWQKSYEIKIWERF
jgi:hypothetical protein